VSISCSFLIAGCCKSSAMSGFINTSTGSHLQVRASISATQVQKSIHVVQKLGRELVELYYSMSSKQQTRWVQRSAHLSRLHPRLEVHSHNSSCVGGCRANEPAGRSNDQALNLQPLSRDHQRTGFWRSQAKTQVGGQQ
jgi:hypothetical protein